MEDNLNKKLDGLKNDFEHKWGNLRDSIENLIDQQQCPQEEECQSDTMVEEQCQQQLLLESSDIGAVVYPWEKKEAVPLLLTEEGSGKETVEEPQELVLNPFPTNNPLPVAPSIDQVYILPTPEAPTIKATPSLPMLKNFKKLVATVQNFATTSKTMAATHISWHSG